MENEESKTSRLVAGSPKGGAPSFESLERLSNSFSSGRGSSVFGGHKELTLPQRNAARLRDCVNPTELTELLSEIWTPNPKAPSAFALDSGQGVVHDIDVSELLFFSENICKKLISFIGFQKTNNDARTATIDVLTWFCTQSALLKSLFVSAEVICNWVMSLAMDSELEVSVAGLRGLVDLVKHEEYRQALHQNDELTHLLDKIDLYTEEGHQAAVFVFMVIHTIISLEGCLKNHESFVRRLKDLAFDHRLSPVREQYWTLNCLVTGVILSKDRVQLMDSLTSVLYFQHLHETVKDLLNEECIDAYLLLLHSSGLEKEHLIVDCKLKSNDIVDKLFKRLASSETGNKNKLLTLLIAIAEDNPERMCSAFLDGNWLTLEEILEKGSAEEKVLILDLFTAVAEAAPPTEKRSLQQHEHGTRLVKLLVEEIDQQKTGILVFIWKHYTDAKDAFIDANVVQSMMSLYCEPDIEIDDVVNANVKEILCTLLEDSSGSIAEIHDQVTQGLKSVIGWGNAETERNLYLVLDILAKVTSPSYSPRIMQWLVDEGLAAIDRALWRLDRRLKDEDMRDNLSVILERTMKSFSESKNDRGFFVKKFVTTAKMVDSCANSVLVNSTKITSHNWADEFYETKQVDGLSVPADVTFEAGALTAIGCVMKENASDRNGFLHCLFQILLEAGLRRSTSQAISSSGIADNLRQILNDWQYETDVGRTSKAFVLCIGTIIGKEESSFQPNDQTQSHSHNYGNSSPYGSPVASFGRHNHLFGQKDRTFSSQSQGCTAMGMTNLWNLIIKHGQDLCSDDGARENVFCFLRKFPRNGSYY